MEHPPPPIPSITSSHPTPPPPGITAPARNKLALLCSSSDSFCGLRKHRPEDCVGTALSDNPEGPLVQYTYQPWPSLCWKVTVSVASLLLLLGVAALTTGYAVPPKLELVNDSKFSSLDDPVADYNQALITCRVAGATLCGAAGILLAVCLFLATSGWLNPDIKAEPLVTDADSPVEVFRDEPEQLSPGFHGFSSQSWLLIPTSPVRQCSVQTSQPQRDS